MVTGILGGGSSKVCLTKKKSTNATPLLTWLSKPDGFPKKLADEAMYLDSLLLKNDGLEDSKVGLLLIINVVSGPL